MSKTGLLSVYGSLLDADRLDRFLMQHFPAPVQREEEKSFDALVHVLAAFFRHLFVEMTDKPAGSENFSPLVREAEAHLTDRMYERLRPSFVLFINDCRKKGKLAGANEREQYAYFVRNFFWGNSLYKPFFQKYPLLLERLSVLFENEYTFVRWITGCLVNVRTRVVQKGEVHPANDSCRLRSGVPDHVAALLRDSRQAV